MFFEKNGFLGKEAEVIADRILERNKMEFELCFDINQLAYEIKSKLVIHNLDGQEVLAACLFSRLLEDFQAGVILAKCGLEHDVRVIIRSVLESLFPLKICCEDESFYVEYFNSHEATRLKIMNVAQKYKGQNLFRGIREEFSKKDITELKEKIKKENIKELKAEDLARRAGMQKYYDLHYRHCSSAVHSLPKSLEKYVTHDGENISGLIHQPTDEDTQMHLNTLAELSLKAIASMSLLFDIEEYKIAINDLHKELQSLMSNYP